MPNTFKTLKNEIIDTGLCTHCGTCIGLSNKQLIMKQTNNGPIPISVSEEINLDQSKVTVLVNIFGRETPVELGFTDIVKN